MKHFGYSVEVQTTSTLIFSTTVNDLVNVFMASKGDLEIGIGGVTYGSGLPMASGVTLGFNHDDFKHLADVDKDTVINIYAVANAAAADMRVSGFVR